MTHLRFPLIPLLAALCILSPLPVRAQNILVTTGEHADFTRLVLQSARPIDWQLDTGTADSTVRTLRVMQPEASIDISRAFRRIPRSRLGDLVRTPEGLELRLNCDCPIEAWTERPGLVVFDISTPRAAEAPSARAASPSALLDTPVLPRSGMPQPFTDDNLARVAGRTLAREWITEQEHPGITGPASRQGPPPSPISETERQAIMQQLTTQVAGALTQGILDPSHERSAAAEMIRLGDGDTPSAIPPNLRIMSVLDRPDDDSANLPDDSPNACAAAAALDFVTATAPESFNAALAEGMSRWIGEFDQPGQAGTEDLVILYLQHGFGAEARALIENAVQPIAGRDLLLGFADTQEGRHSNSRLRLAEQHRCGGPAAMLAALAGAPLPQIRAQAGEIASTYTQAPGILRTGLGASLIRIMVDADAIDAARVIADTLRRTPHARSEDLLMADVLLERARGESLSAGARLSHEAGDDAESLLLHLQIALETGAMVPESVLLNAEAIAGMHRATRLGTDILAAAIRNRVAAGSVTGAVTLLDRLASWQGHSSQGRALVTELSDLVWLGLARQASDADLLDAILNRTDWRDPSHSVLTRTALAERLLGFGLTEAARMLLDPPRAETERHLLARLHLESERPDLALSVLTDDQSEAAANLRARALQARGDGRASSEILAGMGAYEAAAQHAVLAQDWGMLEETRESSGTHSQRELARALASLATHLPSPSRSPAGPGAGPALTAAPVPDGPASQERDTQDETSGPGNATAPAPLRAIAPASASAAGDTVPALPEASAVTDLERPNAPDSADRPEPDAMARSARLLVESERLRAAFAPLISGPGSTRN